MGWTNDQATNLNGQAFTYTNTTVDYTTGSMLSLDSGAGIAATGSTWNLNSSSTLVVDSTSDVTIAGYSLPRGLVAYNRITTDSPLAGSSATTAATADTVITTTLASCVKGRMYQIVCPGLAVRMNVAARTGVQMTITEDGSTPTPSSTLMTQQFVNCPTANSPVPVPMSCLYARATTTGALKVLISIWNVSGGGATVANGHSGPDFTPIEVMILDLGKDVGSTS